jgi:hypothetical protein
MMIASAEMGCSIGASRPCGHVSKSAITNTALKCMRFSGKLQKNHYSPMLDEKNELPHSRISF